MNIVSEFLHDFKAALCDFNPFKKNNVLTVDEYHYAQSMLNALIRSGDIPNSSYRFKKTYVNESRIYIINAIDENTGACYPIDPETSRFFQ